MLLHGKVAVRAEIARSTFYLDLDGLAQEVKLTFLFHKRVAVVHVVEAPQHNRFACFFLHRA